MNPLHVYLNIMLEYIKIDTVIIKCTISLYIVIYCCMPPVTVTFHLYLTGGLVQYLFMYYLLKLYHSYQSQLHCKRVLV